MNGSIVVQKSKMHNYLKALKMLIFASDWSRLLQLVFVFIFTVFHPTPLSTKGNTGAALAFVNEVRSTLGRILKEIWKD